MALFGAPIAHEDHAQRACYAALHLTDELRSFAHGLRREHGLDFSVRMGLNSGDVVVGKIGDDLRMDYTAQGATIGLAERLEQIAEAGKPYLGSATASRITGYFEVEDLGEFKLKGVSSPVPVFGLAGVGPMRSRLDVSRARGFSRFVGRADEMAVLEAALERALAGQGQVIGIVGEAGVGKSRLCEEFLERARSRGVRTNLGRCVSHGKMMPMLPMLEAWRSYFGILEQDGDETARDKVAGRMLRTDPESGDDVPIMLDFLGIPDPARPLPPIDPEARQREVLRIARQLLRGRTEPLAILYEDLHWIDAASEAFLDGLLQSVEGATLVLSTFRPEFRAPWAHRSYYQQLAVLPLRTESVSELLADLLGPELATSELGGRICERSGGNPFFIEEIVQSLAESRHLEGTKGSYRLARPIEEFSIPTSVEGLLAARIDRLPEREKVVLQTAAVIERSFPLRLLERIVQLPAPELAGALRALEDAELVYQTALHPDIEYAFKHPLTHEVAYRSQLGDRRRRLHRGLALALQEIHADKLGEQAALVAHHFEAADEPLEAAGWHARAAAWMALRDPVAALRHWDAVRASLGSAQESPESMELGLRASIAILLSEARTGIAGRDPEVIFTEGRSLAQRTGDSGSLALLTAVYALGRCSAGAIEESLELLEEAEPLAEAANSDIARGVVSYIRAYAGFLTGDLPGGLQTLEQERAAMPGLDLETPGFGFRGGRYWYIAGLFRVYMGRLEEARRDLARAAEVAWEGGDFDTPARAYATQAMLERFAGDAHSAQTHAAKAMEVAQRVGAPRILAIGHLGIAEAHLSGERWDAAAQAFERALEAYLGGTTRNAEPQFRAGLAEAQLGMGDGTRARENAERAVELAGTMGTRIFALWAELALLRVLLRTEGAAAAAAIEAIATRLGALIDETGAESFRPLLCEERARLAQVLGDGSTHERHLREAHRLYTEMGATGHVERLGRELAPA
jgi:adenylate cyclase